MAQLQASTVAGTLTTTGNVGIGTVSLFSGTELDVWGDITPVSYTHLTLPTNREV